MKNYFLFTTALFYILFTSCAQETKKENKPGLPAKINYEAGKIYTVSCNADNALTYSLYLPASFDSIKPFPIIYLFDPQGDGKLPIEKYKVVADEFGVILAGSNNTKNGMEWNAVNNMASILFSDTKQKFKTGKIFTCGFSGGGRIASNLGLLNNTVSGVISCSAGLPAPAAQMRKELAFAAIAGKEDMNLTEIYEAGEALKNSGIKHHISYFNGPHEWPPIETLKAAVGFCLDPSLSAIETSNDINSKIIAQEKQQKQAYSEAIVKNDLKWWQQEFKKLEEKTANKTAGEGERYMNIRLKNFLSLAAYSYSNSALNSNRLPEADKFLSIYKLVDPQNSEHAYLRAKYFVLMSNTAEAGKALNEAAELGFNDKERLKKETLFLTLQNSEGYKKIIEK